jgi:hypothetical protein
MLDTTEEKRRFALMLTGLSEYYRQEVSKAMAGIYWEGLKQYDIGAIEKAAHAHMQSPDENGRWFPKISDLAKYLEGSTTDQASLAWSKVDRALRSVGTYADVIFDDPVIHCVLQDMGGWVPLGDKTTDEWPFVAKEFQTRYRGYRMRTSEVTPPRRLTGMANLHNSASGMPLEPARLIGSEEKCLDWLKITAGNKPLQLK